VHQREDGDGDQEEDQHVDRQSPDQKSTHTHSFRSCEPRPGSVAVDQPRPRCSLVSPRCSSSPGPRRGRPASPTPGSPAPSC
jgi:hypothetical protein